MVNKCHLGTIDYRYAIDPSCLLECAPQQLHFIKAVRWIASHNYNGQWIATQSWKKNVGRIEIIDTYWSHYCNQIN